MSPAQRKQQAYSPLQEALSYNTGQGWIVHVSQWVVGIRVMLDPAHVESLLKFIGVQQKQWKVAAERLVLASVRAFHFLDKVRFGGLSYATRSDLNSDHSDCEQEDSKDGAVAKRKSSGSRASLALGNTDSDSKPTLKQNPGQHTGPHRRRVEPCPLLRRTPGLVGTDPQAQEPPPLDSPPAQVQIAATPCRPKQLHGTEPDGNAPTSGAAELLVVPPPARCIWPLRPQVLTPAAERAESRSQSGNAAGSAPTLSTQISLPNYQPVNSNVQQMISRKRCGSAGDRWNHDGGGGPDVEEAAQHHQPMC
jgi:hypothetical protein